jgi:hypothetical protein
MNIKTSLKETSKSIYNWFYEELFGGSKITFDENNVKITITGAIYPTLQSRQLTWNEIGEMVETRDTKLETLLSKGFDIDTEYSAVFSSDLCLGNILATDKNRELLIKILKDKFPSSEIISFLTIKNGDNYIFDKIEICITNIDDVL